jgi:DNA-binding CsgD family transcriptional regulator
LFDELVGLAYDAPFSSWMPFLRSLSTLTRSRATAIKWVAHRPRGFHMIADGLESAPVRGYRERYAELDVWSHVDLGAGADVFGDEMVPRRVFERSEFYRDFCRAHEIADIHKIMLAKEPSSQVSIALFKDRGRIDRARERELTRRLAPHLRRAVALASRVADANDVRGALADALELQASAAFLLDARGRIRHATPRAEAIALANDGLRITQRGLRASLADDDRELAAYLRGRLDAPSMHVRRPSGAPPYRVVAMPRKLSLDAAIAMVVVVVETRAPAAAEARLRRELGLTRAEASVAMRVGRGAAPKQVASELGVSWYTVRAQLREIFAKTGVRRQAQLVELVSRLEHGR